MSKLNNTIHYFAKNPRRLFFIDAIGAAISATLLFTILGNFNEYFGMPENAINVLSAVAVFLCMYGLTCYETVKKEHTGFIKLMYRTNFFYCIITAGCVIMYFEDLTPLGMAYFLVETVIIGLLAYIEFSVTQIIKETE